MLILFLIDFECLEMFCCSFAVLIITTEEFTFIGNGYAVPSLFEVHLLSY